MSRKDSRSSGDRGLWVQCACTLLVALGAAYASYRHGQRFALRFGADPTTAAIWPLIVDGLLTTATVELWKPARGEGRWRAWLAFLFGVALSLCANIASAPELSAFAIAVAACPPLALLLAVELLNRALKRHRANTSQLQDRSMGGEGHETDPETTKPATETPSRTGETTADANIGPSLAIVSATSARRELTAEQRMWVYYKAQRARGRTPSGAELDRFAGTNNYSRRVLRHWVTDGHLTTRAGVR
jgi:uncharacterized protein DUF2637